MSDHSRRYRGRWLKPLTVMGACVMLAGCTTLPSNSEPQALRSFDPSPSSVDQGPKEDEEPDLLLRDFYRASAVPLHQYQQARSYLVEEAAQAWAPAAGALILDRIDINSAKNSTGEGRAFDVSGTVVGELGQGGAYAPKNERYKATIRLKQVDGQWRIAELPNRIVLERSELRNQYSMRDVYFFNPAGNQLIADHRWIYGRASSLDTSLISLLVAGPSVRLAAGVMDELPQEAAFAGVKDGVYEFTGLANMSGDALDRFAAQIVWSLGVADIPGPYHLSFDGNPVRINGSDSNDLTVDDFAEYNPQASSNSINRAYAVLNNRLVSVRDGQVSPVEGEIGRMNNLESATASAKSDTVAAVQSTGTGQSQKSRLVIGQVGGEAATNLNAKTLSRPTFEQDATSVWTVVDGKKVARIARSANTGEIAQTEVDTSSLGDHGEISVLQLSSDGVRVAFIVDGKVYLGIVSRPRAGERKLVNVVEFMPTMTDTAISLAWLPDGRLLVGTSSSDTPVWALAPDGSSALAAPTGNISAPVVSISANNSVIFATDSRATLEMPVDMQSALYWREVPGLEGGRALMVIPH